MERVAADIPENKILPIDTLPRRESSEEDEIVVEILSDTQLMRDNRVYSVSPNALAINGLLMHRHRAAGLSEIADTIDLQYSNFTLLEGIKTLAAGLEYLCAEPALHVQGSLGHRQYQLDSRLDFYDLRNEDTPELNRRRFGVSGLPSLDEASEQLIQFDQPNGRRQAVKKLLSHHTNDSALEQSIAELTQDTIPELDHETLWNAFVRLERGLVGLLQDDQNTETQFAQLDGAMAYHEILISTLPIIQESMWRYGRSTEGRLNDELVQEGSIAIMELIMNLTHERVQTDERYFYKLCYMHSRGAMWEALRHDRFYETSLPKKHQKLFSKVIRAQGELNLELSREPSPAEISERIEKATIEEVEECLYLIEEGNSISLNIEEQSIIENIMHKSGYYSDTIENHIKEAYQQDLIDQLFKSPELDDREKIVLSVYFGVYAPELRDVEFEYKSWSKANPFTYPLNEGEFQRLAIATQFSNKVTASRLQYSEPMVRRTLNEALRKAKNALKEEYDIADI